MEQETPKASKQLSIMKAPLGLENEESVKNVEKSYIISDEQICPSLIM